MSDDNRILDAEALSDSLMAVRDGRLLTKTRNREQSRIYRSHEALRAALDTAEAREGNAWDAVQSKEARLLGTEAALKQMTRERDTAWRMYLEQLDESADAKTAHELAEARVGALEAALRELLADAIPERHVVQPGDDEPGYCEFCRHDWPCPTEAARALLGEPDG